MPRYFFSKFYDGGRAIDEVGAECASVADARRKAVEALPVAALDASPALNSKGAYSIHVTDAAGTLIYIATLSVFPIDQVTPSL